jgi:hypothetical protein
MGLQSETVLGIFFLRDKNNICLVKQMQALLIHGQELLHCCHEVPFNDFPA